MKYERWWGFWILFFSCAVSSAYLYEIKILRKWDEQNNQYHYFIGCSDFHDRFHGSNGAQRRALMQKLSAVDKQQVLVLLEDLSSPNTAGEYGCSTYTIRSCDGILASLTKECQKKGLEVQNLEYRYCRVIALGCLLKNYEKKIPSLWPTRELTVEMLLAEIKNALQDIRSYQDGSLLAEWYKNTYHMVEQSIRWYKFEQYATMNLALYIDIQAPSWGRQTFLKQLLTFDSSLLDCKLVHATVQSQKQKVIAIAGGTHIQRVVHQLERIGYQTIYATPAHYKTNSLHGCVNSQTATQPHTLPIKPKPVTLDVLDNFLYQQ
jgi:hypothetical protein